MSVFAGVDALASPDAPLVTTDDYAEWYSLGTFSSLTADQQNRIQTSLEIASALIRNGRRIFSPVSADVVTVDSYGGASLLLPRNRLPVTAVSLVEQLSGADYVTTDSTEYDWSADGYLSRYWSCWAARPQGVRVTYDHGYAILPREVAGVCLALAKRVYDNPTGQSVTSETLGDASVTYSGATGLGLLPEESLALHQYEARA